MLRDRQSPSTSTSLDGRGIEICILAGGNSRRMGRDKTRVRIGPRTLLGHVRLAAKASGLPVRVIRRDLMERCGPLGGVYTALATSQAEVIVFLSCDMPFVSPGLLRKIVSRFQRHKGSWFVARDEVPGFPFLLQRADLASVEHQLKRGAFSVRGLVSALKAHCFDPQGFGDHEFLNVNTPQELSIGRRCWQEIAGRASFLQRNKAGTRLVKRRKFR
ncbi:MAG TPA: molybdenum cofactor guanylyltransferase [Verrucomicrobiae bacterium]|nr:molybdenum cofactor guanylyltransferase [Verrucomicrobiae bacterium]